MNKSSTPGIKQIQYDRQLRLWGDHGQKALESGRVCLIGANALGTEILKALVLPGLGSFTIIDHELVTLADCGSNFFVHSSMINQSRARITCDFLTQLNPDVHGIYIDKPSIDDLLKQNTFDFSQFNIVITANLSINTLNILANHLWMLKIPLLVARIYGFIGTIRLQIFEHYVIEAHPDDTIPDLRLDQPLNTFINYCNSIDLNSLTREEHLHLPSLIILFKTLQIWQKQHNRNDLPHTHIDKDEFKKILDQLSHHSSYDIHDKEKYLENFEEAKRTIPSRLVKTNLPSTIKELFQDQSCFELSEQTNIFWFIIHAIKLFTENEGQGLLPVRGEVPDMITNTDSYIKILKIYQEQAKKDCEIVNNYLFDLLKKYRLSNEYIDSYDLAEIYCNNASFLKVLRTTAIKNENNLIDETDSNLSWYIGLYLCDLFYEKFHRYPGEFLSDDRQFEIDLNDLKQISKKLSSKHFLTDDKQQILEELCRYGASELHSIAAFIGGCCAQEAIKLITHQYIPIDNTLIYNGIQQSINKQYNQINADPILIEIAWTAHDYDLHTIPSLQLVTNPLVSRQFSPISNKIFTNLQQLNAEYARYAVWFPYPKLAVAELDPPSGLFQCSNVGENYSIHLSCEQGGGVISKIDFASFGTAIGACGQMKQGTCDAANSSDIIQRACIGQQKCSVTASTDLFGDPCTGTPKRLLVQIECNPPQNNTYWNFTHIDPMLEDFLKATDGHSRIISFSTQPTWLFQQDTPHIYPDNATYVDWGYPVGTKFIDDTMQTLGDYYGRLFAWYTRGGFIDEYGLKHNSGYEYDWDYTEIFNEVEAEHQMTVEYYTRAYDAVIQGIRRHTNNYDMKYVGMALGSKSLEKIIV
ncbi:unnamed protein product [Rotaria sordida]|uniref:SUEL-type lectin domain-containing protein n=1 Tax=Rotaria sordida TaxID=392033 RepID=A0A813X8C7_9BILA|nr:unnamed protein product [Rotaria sordida]